MDTMKPLLHAVITRKILVFAILVFNLANITFSASATESIDVKCGRVGMNVNVKFNQSFQGVIYSKGHFYEPNCNYVKPQESGRKEFSFQIPYQGCGGSNGNSNDRQSIYETTIIIQNDPLIQEIWDTARLLTCNQQNFFSKSVHAQPVKVENSEKVDVVFDSNAFNSVMKIEKSTSPFSKPAEGLINIGDASSIVIYIKDATNQLDANVISCSARSTRGESVNLVDKNGCLLRPNLLTPFKKIKKPSQLPEDSDIVLYSNFTAFRIGDDSTFKLTCQLEICEVSCLDPCILGPYEDLFHTRSKRDITIENKSSNHNSKTRNITLEHSVIVIKNLDGFYDAQEQGENCYLIVGFTVLIMLMILIFSITLQIVLMKLRTRQNYSRLETVRHCPNCEKNKARYVEAFRFRITDEECNEVLAQKDANLISKIGGKDNH